ncbi:patatin-like phospholipase family protein [Ramlibacter sp. XY19]|uniref:patatin-like phospholipase family protein n=1 Tax=Ramlibacter paludis TaxID=2908000 RepID=UPI0023DB06B8|nr:patatin-like phospholipase family protein [Ramlibacter paludis]MCG2595440.1 patatin-like phospholipase family protein [Ramlibacter paludis]
MNDPMDTPGDRFCDIVMEGGITSGIIYASAVAEMAGHYRFKSIGGSSIGAFAAALTAAAEYRRRQGYGDGFTKLENLPEELAKEEGGRTRLERCFVPQPATRRPFKVFLATLDRSGPVTCFLFGLLEALRQYVVFILAAVLVLAGINAGLFIVAPVFALGVAVFLGMAVGIAWDFGHGVVPNGFGLCRGWDREAKNDSTDLAAYLHGSIQLVAGRDPKDDPPLTFRDLWEAPGAPSQVLGLPQRRGERSIDLEVYASNLTHGRPYRFPLEGSEDMGRLFFRVDELENYFPKGIVDYVAAFSKPYEARSEADPPAWRIPSVYRELPVEDLPIVVAARFAMSFPLLISAVPLYAVNHERQTMERCWISDGGLCSNFPIHLFDSFLPMWPTFGISLNTRSADDPRRVVLPQFHTSGRGESWDFGPDESFWKLGAFLVSLWKTTWRWNDSTMMRMPGVRDRVVRIYLANGEGGVNIRMRADKIRLLGTTYGAPAGQAFVRKFAAAGSAGWEEHRWVRFNCLAISMRDRLRNFRRAVALDRHATPLRTQISDALLAPPLRRPGRRQDRTWPSEQKLTQAQVDELQQLVIALCILEYGFEPTGAEEAYRAIPRASLRMRHPT